MDMLINDTEISRRWKSAAKDYKWDTAFDHGYNGKSELPNYLQYSVESEERSCFAIEEVEWCVSYCKGRFVRRYSTLKSVHGRKKLTVMVFQHERDALAFEAYLLLTTPPKLKDDSTISLNSGGAYIITLTEPLLVLSKWCFENCEGDYIISRLTTRKFIWFEKESDLIHFKLYVMPAENNENDY